MVYAFQTVSIGGVGEGQDTVIINNTDMGMPSTYPCVLWSIWTTCPQPGGEYIVGPNTSDTFSVVLYSSAIDISADNLLTHHQIGHVFGASVSSMTPGRMTHVLVSLDGPNNIMQAYVNDVAVTLAPTWVTHEEMSNNGAFNVQIHSPLLNTLCIGDIWFSNQDTFTDLTITSNRRKFINADLSPVDLGDNGEIPFGSAPPMFLHCPVGGAPADFVANAGTGGAFTPGGTGVLALPFGSCGLVGAQAIAGLGTSGQVGTLTAQGISSYLVAQSFTAGPYPYVRNVLWSGPKPTTAEEQPVIFIGM